MFSRAIQHGEIVNQYFLLLKDNCFKRENRDFHRHITGTRSKILFSLLVNEGGGKILQLDQRRNKSTTLWSVRNAEISLQRTQKWLFL